MRNKFWENKIFFAALWGLILTMSVTGCGKGSESNDSSSAETSAVSADTESSAESSADTSSAEEEASTAETESSVNEQGEYIKKAYDFFNGDSYTINVKFTDYAGEVLNISKTVKGDDYYQIQESRVGTSGTIKVGEECYDFDNVCGVYRESTSDMSGSIVETVVEENLPQTYSHITDEDSENYIVEEYTYTGDTYITVLDFCFDKETGDLVKYTSTYSVEGADDEIETREFTSLSDTADESLFDLTVATSLKDFEGMTADERQTYCKSVLTSAGVTEEKLAEAGFTYEDLKDISYDDFVNTVYIDGYDFL